MVAALILIVTGFVVVIDDVVVLLPLPLYNLLMCAALVLELRKRNFRKAYR